MLKKTNRLSRTTFPRKRPDAKHSFSWGRASFHNAPRFGASIVVSKKVARFAHERNRLRRRLYAAAEAAYTGTSLPKVHIVVFPRFEALSAPFTKLVNDLKGALS
ncbi:MAG: ribonuclease P protein component [Candidatus Paceibacteria bacterium]